MFCQCGNKERKTEVFFFFFLKRAYTSPDESTLLSFIKFYSKKLIQEKLKVFTAIASVTRLDCVCIFSGECSVF